MAEPAFPFPIITLRGGPYERGEQYGRLARDRIDASLDHYMAAWLGKDASSRERNEILGRARYFVSAIGDWFPAMIEEIGGIADGSGHDIEEIVALNARTEILFGREEPEGCTSAALLPEVTGGATILGQNWDWRAACRDTAVVLRVLPDEGPAFMTAVEAGMLARAGFNDAGVGVCGNFLACAADGKRDGLPIPVIRRAILESEPFRKRWGTCSGCPAHSSNHLLAHREGEAVDLEVTPDDAYTMFPEDGILAHANHFVAGAGIVRDTGRARFPDTLFRDRRLRRHLVRRGSPLRVGDLQTALKDHFGHPHGICRHMPAGRADPTVVVTVFSVVMDLSAQRMWIAPGPPCETEYTEIEPLSRARDPEMRTAAAQ